jgi:cytochrome c oxidase subunit 2
LDNLPEITYDSYMVPELNLNVLKMLRLLEVDFRVVLPISMLIKGLVSSTDVLHSWSIPSFGVKIDACPGRLNQVNIFIQRTGLYYGQCSEICGSQHAFMPITVQSTTLIKYIDWIYRRAV